MSASNIIAKGITNDCENVPMGGFERIAWILNWGTATFTFGAYRPLITNIVMVGSSLAHLVRAVKKENEAGFNFRPDDMGDQFEHFFSVEPLEDDAESIQNIDDMNKIVLIAEKKGEKKEGTFVAFGVDVGLYKSRASMRTNNNKGVPLYDFQTLPGLGERYSRFVIWDTDYDTTKALLSSLVSQNILAENEDELVTEADDLIILE